MEQKKYKDIKNSYTESSEISENVKINGKLCKKLFYDSPIGVASCHFTENKEKVDEILKYSPSFFTIKTVNDKICRKNEEGRKIINLGYLGYKKSFISTGSRNFELLNSSRLYDLENYIIKKNINIPMGISVLCSENLESVLNKINLSLYSFIEVNLKYVLRELEKECYNNPETAISRFYSKLDKVINILNVLVKKPIFIKINTDTNWIISRRMQKIINKSKNEIGLIISNSKHRIIIPREDDLLNPKIAYSSKCLEGSLSGKLLFLDTLYYIRRLRQMGFTFPIIASGGIQSGYDVFFSLIFGADAVQLSTVFNVRGIDSIRLIREELINIMENQEIYSMKDLFLKRERYFNGNSK